MIMIQMIIIIIVKSNPYKNVTFASLTVASPWKGTANLFTFKPAPRRTCDRMRMMVVMMKMMIIM